MREVRENLKLSTFQAVDIWAAGLVLYAICFNKHPFDDSNKLAIVNGNYKIPASDSKYRMYHSLISSMLTLDPRQRPSAGQVLDQLSAIAETEGFRCRGSLANIESPQQHLLSPTQTPTQDLPPRLPDGPTIFNPETQPASSNVSMLKASAGSLFSRLKDTTKTVVASVQSSMVGKELDFHCITSRVAAMSLPVEGLESAYRNHIDDVRALMENKHSNYYTVFNVSERQSNPSKYPSGHLVEAGWPAGAVPSLDAVLELCTKMLDYLSRDLRNVLVVYCLDGKSSTAYIVSALLIYSGLASSVEAAVTIFSAKRCDPVLTSCQLESLRHLASLAVSKLPVLKSPFVTVTNVVVEPVPLFNKAGDGCRPYVEVYQGKERVISTVQEYSRMKGYSVTAGDEDIVIPVNVTVCGDVTIIVNHARQVLGSIKPVKICQVQLHTSSLTAGRPSYQWKLSQLDCVAEAARYSDGFQLVMNCETSEECSGRDVQWPDESAALLLFNSDQDYEMVKSLAPGTSTRAPVSPDGGNSKFYVNNPDLNRDEENSSRATAAPSASSVRPPVSVDLLGLSEAGPAQQESLISSLSGPRPPAPEKSHIDLLAAAAPAPRPPAPEKSKIDLLAAVAPTPAPPAASANTFDFLADLNGPSAANNKPAPPAGNISDLFGGSDKFSAPVLNATSIPRGTSQPDIKTDAVEDNFDPFSNLSNLSASLSSQNIAAGQNKPVNPGPQKPMNSMGNSTGFSQQKPQSKPMGPNYSRSFFSDSSNSVGGVKPKVSMNAFDDLLGGFTPSANPSQNQSIGAMKKTELVKAMDPDEAKIFEWKEGKSRNIRTLLCSLHKIIWAGARWSECGMHQLVSSNDVKKMYRKACLAVHPDKQMGTENENISKLIFMELNEAWSEFENDPNQQNMFG